MLTGLQVVGALLILAPFVAQQIGRLKPDAPTYLWPNLIGSAALAALAILGAQWGFVLLEVVWMVVAARSLVRLARGGHTA